MDLSIFDAFEKPASSKSKHNDSREITTLSNTDGSSSTKTENKRKRDDLSTSFHDDETAGTEVEVTVTMNNPANPAQGYIPAKEYKFKLDTFQQTAVDHIERGESVLVAAHTSAGFYCQDGIHTLHFE